MNPLKHLWQALGEPVRQAWFFSRTLARAAQRRRRMILNEQEIERLERIRNPSK